MDLVTYALLKGKIDNIEGLPNPAATDVGRALRVDDHGEWEVMAQPTVTVNIIADGEGEFDTDVTPTEIAYNIENAADVKFWFVCESLGFEGELVISKSGEFYFINFPLVTIGDTIYFSLVSVNTATDPYHIKMIPIFTMS